MNLVSVLNLFGSSKLFSRQCSTKKASRIKLLNSDTKSLFGSVIKGKQKLESKNNVIRDHEKSSEMFWVLGSRWNEIVEDSNVPRKISKVIKTTKPNSDDGKIFSSSQEPVKSNSNSPNEISPKTNKKKILFSEDELKNLMRHPLVTEIITTETQPNLPVGNISSVGNILQCTMPEAARNALMNWKLLKISELGEQGFADLQRSNFETGHAFHHSLQHFFSTNETPLVSSPVHKLWESVSAVLDKFNESPVLVEKYLLHPTLKYKGVCDCVSDVENQLTLIEWKKSARSKPTLDSTYDAPLQLCAYLGALHSIPEYRGRIKQGMVVIAYEDGKQADVYKLDEIMLRKYWRAWLARLHEFWIRTRDDTLLERI